MRLKRNKPTRKRAIDLSLHDSIVMPSGRPYEIRELVAAGDFVMIEAAVPNTGNSRVEHIQIHWGEKVEVA